MLRITFNIARFTLSGFRKLYFRFIKNNFLNFLLRENVTFADSVNLTELPKSDSCLENVAFVKPDKVVLSGVHRRAHVQQRPRGCEQKPDGLL